MIWSTMDSVVMSTKRTKEYAALDWLLRMRMHRIT